jgi:hypothetical protein
MGGAPDGGPGDLPYVHLEATGEEATGAGGTAMETFAADSHGDSTLLKRLWPVIDVYGRVARAAARAETAVLLPERTRCAVSA